jgi:hypothetical protein
METARRQDIFFADISKTIGSGINYELSSLFSATCRTVADHFKKRPIPKIHVSLLADDVFPRRFYFYNMDSSSSAVIFDRARAMRLVCWMLTASGLIQGYLIMDSAFDYNVETLSRNAQANAFAYYSTILNNRIVNVATVLIISITHFCSYGLWKGYRALTSSETQLSITFRNIFFQYCFGSFVYMVFVIPRYLTFVEGSEPPIFHPEMFKDWTFVLMSRVILAGLNLHVLYRVFQLIPEMALMKYNPIGSVKKSD